MIRLFLVSIYQIVNEISKKIMSLAEPIQRMNGKEPFYKTMEDAGHAQWYDFSLKNTPDVRKKGVTDISKYYA
jgi:hypothetical protein